MSDYREWDGDYEKGWYEVKTKDGVYLCWPNAGAMFVGATLSGKKNNNGQFFIGDDFIIRESDKHPMDYIGVDIPEE